LVTLAANLAACDADTTGEAEHWAAVLALFSERDDPDLVFTVRSAALRHHPGQISFPGGGREAGDAGFADTALREAREEVGLDPAAVAVLGRLPDRRVSVSAYQVVPVVGWWPGNQELARQDDAEVEEVMRWRVSELADPANRAMAVHPRGFLGPAFTLGDYFLWGFTAGRVDELLRLGGWEEPWDESRQLPIPRRFLRDAPA
jgi:8-oxo-dGTP pyrophosphatase MutT (NUDIX family)